MAGGRLSGKVEFEGIGPLPPPRSGGGEPCEAWWRGLRSIRLIPTARGPLHRADARSPSPVPLRFTGEDADRGVPFQIPRRGWCLRKRVPPASAYFRTWRYAPAQQPVRALVAVVRAAALA